MSKFPSYSFDIKFQEESTFDEGDKRMIGLLREMSQEGRDAYVEGYKRARGIRELPEHLQRAIKNMNNAARREKENYEHQSGQGVIIEDSGFAQRDRRRERQAERRRRSREGK